MLESFLTEINVTAIDGKVVNLGPEGIQDEPDLSVCCDALLIDDYNIEELEEFLEAPTLILLEVQPIFEVSLKSTKIRA